MPRLTFEGAVYDCRPQESVLDAFLRQGVVVPFSCRSGICHACLQRCVQGPVPVPAQASLSNALRALGYFLPCKCVPVDDMEIVRASAADLFQPALVRGKEWLANDVCRLLLEPGVVLDYRPGQFVNLRRREGLVRSYSLASVPENEYFLELHVKRMKNGEMSNLICDELRVGDEIELQGPLGQCCYVPGEPDRSLLLLATGTGLAPLVGVLRDALNQGHTGPIHLYHGVRTAAEAYLRETLRALSKKHENFFYTACLSGRRRRAEGFVDGHVQHVALADHGDLAGWRVYLAGLPEMIESATTLAVAAGAQPDDIVSDLHVLKDLRSRERAPLAAGSPGEPSPAPERGVPDPAPAPEIWAALREGELLLAILTDFYARVYADPRLAPFFRGITRQRSIEKQFLFLRQVFAGEKVYFGDRPRNAHHWMVISDELFDYRERLMETCLREHGLAEPLIKRWIAIEEHYRADIIKSSARSRIVDGVELPVEGFGECTLDVGSLCDGCQREIHPGELVRYHLRLGSTYCAECSARQRAAG